MDEWVFTDDQLKDTPSIRHGMSHKLEEKARREGVRIIMDVGSKMGLRANPTMATAALYFHRFYMSHTFQEFPRQVVYGFGIPISAGKAEETPKKCKDVCQNAMEKFTLCKYYRDAKVLQDEVMGIERVLLQTLKFDLQVEHPYKYLIDYVKAKNTIPRDDARYKEIMSGYIQTAWTFVNDSTFTTLALKWEPQIIAIAMIHLSMTMAKKRDEKVYFPDGEWWSEYVANLSTNILDSIGQSVLEFYTLSREETMDPETTGAY